MVYPLRGVYHAVAEGVAEALPPEAPLTSGTQCAAQAYGGLATNDRPLPRDGREGSAAHCSASRRGSAAAGSRGPQGHLHAATGQSVALGATSC